MPNCAPTQSHRIRLDSIHVKKALLKGAAESKKRAQDRTHLNVEEEVGSRLWICLSGLEFLPPSHCGLLEIPKAAMAGIYKRQVLLVFEITNIIKSDFTGGYNIASDGDFRFHDPKPECRRLVHCLLRKGPIYQRSCINGCTNLLISRLAYSDYSYDPISYFSYRNIESRRKHPNAYFHKVCQSV